MFELVSKYKPSGDQPQAIDKLVNGINNNEKHQVLLGATGTGKTFKVSICSLFTSSSFDAAVTILAKVAPFIFFCIKISSEIYVKIGTYPPIAP